MRQTAIGQVFSSVRKDSEKIAPRNRTIIAAKMTMVEPRLFSVCGVVLLDIRSSSAPGGSKTVGGCRHGQYADEPCSPLTIAIPELAPIRVAPAAIIA